MAAALAIFFEAVKTRRRNQKAREAEAVTAGAQATLPILKPSHAAWKIDDNEWGRKRVRFPSGEDTSQKPESKRGQKEKPWGLIGEGKRVSAHGRAD